MQESVNKKVLIIKNDKSYNNLIKKHFEQNHYQVEMVNNTDDGIKKAIIDKPMMIIVDLNLSNKSNFLYTKRMKANNILRDIPVYVVSENGKNINYLSDFQLAN